MIWVLRLPSCLAFLGTVRFLGDESTILVSNVSMSGSYEKRITFDSEASLLKTER